MEINKLNWHVNVKNIDEYFSMPKDKRSRWGIYFLPLSLPFDPTDKEGIGFSEFNRRIKKEYPIQWFFRDYLFSVDNPVALFFYRIKWKVSDWRYNIKHLLKPCHPRMRKVYPRHEWRDLAYVIPEINIAMLLDFWYQEVKLDIVDWQADEKGREFYKWLSESVKWIEEERPKIQNEIEAEQDRICFEKGYKKDLPFEEKYKLSNDLEKKLQDGENEIVYQMMKYRDYFWT